jgi:hypothetical protein
MIYFVGYTRHPQCLVGTAEQINKVRREHWKSRTVENAHLYHGSEVLGMMPGDELLADKILEHFMLPLAVARTALGQMILDGYIAFRGELPDVDPDEYFASMNALRDWASDRANTRAWDGSNHRLLHVVELARAKPDREPIGGSVGLASRLASRR